MDHFKRVDEIETPPVVTDAARLIEQVVPGSVVFFDKDAKSILIAVASYLQDGLEVRPQYNLILDISRGLVSNVPHEVIIHTILDRTLTAFRIRIARMHMKASQN